MNNYFDSLPDLLKEMRCGHIARAYFGGQYWYVIKIAHVIYYYEPVEKNLGSIVTLTRSNIEANYEITN